MSKLYLYTNTSDRKKINKSLDPIIKDHIDFVFKDPTNIVSPLVTIAAASIPDNKWSMVNYAYLPLFNRYYFVDNIEVEHGGLMTLSLTVDPLYTYRQKLLATSFEVARSESENSRYYIDNEKPILSRKVVDYKIFGEVPQTSGGRKYIITVAGG